VRRPDLSATLEASACAKPQLAQVMVGGRTYGRLDAPAVGS
jgi:hypothetical protein